MRKRPSMRRMKARLLLGRLISRQDLLNYRLDRVVKRRHLVIECRAESDYWRRVA